LGLIGILGLFYEVLGKKNYGERKSLENENIEIRNIGISLSLLLISIFTPLI
jgi:hypothetical protein